MKLDKSLILSTASLIGTIIGAGIFAIPYVIAKTGIIISFFYLLLVAVFIVMLDNFFGEIILKTKEKHRLVGYAGKYLGRWAKTLVTFSTVIGTIGSLLVYIILAGKFLSAVFPSIGQFTFAVSFWGILSIFVFLGINSIASFELIMSSLLFIVFAFIFFTGFSKISPSNFIFFSGKDVFLPFGIFLFSLTGWNAIPEIEKVLKNKINLKKVITFGIILPAVFYFIFGLTIVGISGQATTKEPFSGLVPFLGGWVSIFGGIFGFLAVLTSFLILMNYLKNTFYLDYKLPYLYSFLIASLAPFLLFIAGVRQFISVIAFVGTFVGLIEGTTIALIYRKVKKTGGDRKSEYSIKISPKVFPVIIILILFLGSLSQVIYYFIK